MKSKSIVAVILLSILAYSCTDTLSGVGVGVQPSSDEILVDTATINVSTENIFVESIYSRPDSFLLGTFADDKYGITHAEILAQVKGPTGIGFSYPAGAQADSALINISYFSWFGDSYSPMLVNIYELKKKTFNYTQLYTTNINPSEYVDANASNLIASRIFTAKNSSTTRRSADPYTITLKVDPDFYINRFFKADSIAYKSDSLFSDFFKGMYIKAEYGVATMLKVRQIDLECYYHYTYKKEGQTADTTVNLVQVFPANREVRQVNRFLHPDTAVIKQKLALNDELNYISSPANIQTRVVLPMKTINQKMLSRINGKQLTVNSAMLRVEATEIDDATLAKPLVDYMLLIKETEIESFFAKGELPSESNSAVLAPITSKLISNTTTYKKYYDFNLAGLISKERKLNPNPTGDINLRLIPVKVVLNASGSVAQIKHQNSLSAVTIRSGKNKLSPMRISMMFSGF
jgi:hypothetical protein